MKTISKISIALAIIFLISAGMAIVTGPIMLIPGGFESASINQFEKAEMSGVNAVHVNVPDPDINMYPIPGDEFDIRLTGIYAKNKYTENVNLSVERTGDLLEIKVIYPNINLVMINRDFKLSIGVPENYSGKLKVVSASGDLKLGDFNLESLEVRSVSGEVEIENIKSLGDVSIKTASGDIDIDNLISDNSEIESVSGDITLENVKAEGIELGSVSGDIKAVNSEKIDSASTTSGEISIIDFYLDNDLNLETVSGDVYLELVKDSSIDLDFKTSSGDLDNNFGDVYGGDNKIYVKTSSGDLSIN